MRTTTTPRLARYGPLDRYNAPPAAGMCLSAFVLARSRGRALVGRPAAHEKWDSWMPSWKHYSAADLAATRAGRLLPSAYLREGEAPEAAARRILREMVRARPGFEISPRPIVFSATAPSDWYPGHLHWDIAFVYEAKHVELPARTPAWWRELAWVAPRDMRASEFNWNDDLARELKVATRRGP